MSERVSLAPDETLRPRPPRPEPSSIHNFTPAGPPPISARKDITGNTIRAKNLLAVATLTLAPVLAAQAQLVTVYSADGLHDGSPNWFATEFAAFTKHSFIR